jgi:hypothetical protein
MKTKTETKKHQQLKRIKKVEQLLNDSDIVWPKYGSESEFELATRIVDTLDKEEASPNT